MISAPFIVNVPVKNYLITFLYHEIGESYTLKSRKEPLSRIIFSHLAVKNKKELPVISDKFSYFQVGVPSKLYDRKKLTVIREETVWELNDYFERYFNRLMSEWVKSRLNLKNDPAFSELLKREEAKCLLQVNNSIRDFLRKYEVKEQDLSFETALKRFQRSSGNFNALV